MVGGQIPPDKQPLDKTRDRFSYMGISHKIKPIFTDGANFNMASLYLLGWCYEHHGLWR